MEDKKVSLKEVLDKIQQMIKDDSSHGMTDYDKGYLHGQMDILGDLAQQYNFYEYLIPEEKW